MVYQGSKNKIAKYIVPILQECINKNVILSYIEPFVGGANIIDKISCYKKVGYDNNRFLIELFNFVKKGHELLPKVSREFYGKVRIAYRKQTGEYEDWIVGNVGFLASFGGRFYDGGYIGEKQGNRDRYDEGKRNFEKQLATKGFQETEFITADYREIPLTSENNLIYCDPPYQKTTNYSNSRKFNHSEFWEWVRKQSVNNFLIVSEQTAPDDFVCIWEKEVKRTLGESNNLKATEKLFIHNKGKYYDFWKGKEHEKV